MTNKEKNINALKKLYKDNLDFLSSVEKGLCKKKYKSETIAEYKNLNSHLFDYIQDLEMGLDCHQDLSFWNEMFNDILAEGLDDDNFTFGGDW